MKQNRLLTDASQLFCQNEACPAREQVGAKTIVKYGQKRERYQWKVCQKTFSAWQGTMFEGHRKPVELIVIVVTLLAYGCPLQAIVHAFDLDEGTVARWQKQAGNHCQKVHEERVVQKHLDLQHVQVDEIRVKACPKIPWIAMALQIKKRLWLGGVVSEHRNRQLADALFHQVKQCCLPLQELLVVTDGWAAYPKSIRRVLREKAPRQARRGRCRLLASPGCSSARLSNGPSASMWSKWFVGWIKVWRNEPSSFSPRPKAAMFQIPPVLNGSMARSVSGLPV